MLQNKTMFFCAKMIIVAFALNATPCFAVDPNQYFPGLKIDADGRIETLNNKGAMAPAATGSERWLLEDLKQQKTANMRMLEIGPAFGRMPVEMYLQNFKGKYTAIDLSQEHLTYLENSLKPFPAAKNSLTLITGEFPKDTKNLPSGSYDIILATHVFHFFEPKQFEEAVDELWRLLAPGGKVYVTVKTPYNHRYRSFIPTYLSRQTTNQSNPGYMDNVGAWADPESTPPEKLKKLYGLHLLFFGKEDLKNVFANHNFTVVRCEETPLGYDSPIWQAPKEYANREDAVILAVKPSQH